VVTVAVIKESGNELVNLTDSAFTPSPELIKQSRNDIKKGLPMLTTKSGLKLNQYLTQKYPFVAFSSDNGGEIKFKLPNEFIDEFPTLLDDLEVNKDGLGLLSFGITSCSLTDVFLKVNEGHGRDEDFHDSDDESDGEDGEGGETNANDKSQLIHNTATNKQQDDFKTPLLGNNGDSDNYLTHNDSPSKSKKSNPSSSKSTTKSTDSKSTTTLSDYDIEHQWNTITTESIFKISPIKLWFKHLKAMYLKRFHIAKRDLRAFMWQLLYPTVVLLFGLLMLQYGIPHSFKPLVISPALYPNRELYQTKRLIIVTFFYYRHCNHPPVYPTGVKSPSFYQ
jgi:hypothetical protein